MKRNRAVLVTLVCCFAMLFAGCTEEPQPLCVKCGGEATSTLMGPAEMMRKNGISINDCTLVTGNIYSAPICEACAGPVAKG